MSEFVPCPSPPDAAHSAMKNRKVTAATFEVTLQLASFIKISKGSVTTYKHTSRAKQRDKASLH